MEIRNSFEVPLPPPEAWQVLMDIPRIVPCMPGAELLEQIDERRFKGTVKVKLGPVALAFTGNASFEQIDEAEHSASVKAQGTDSKGRGGANAVVKFQLSPIPAGTRVDVVTDVALSGAVAQYGRGAGIMQAVATQLIGEFATRLKGTIDAEAVAARPASPSASVAAEAGPQPSAPAAAAPPPISGLSLIARVVWDMVRRLFARSPNA